jgi:hypothetical protein
MGALFSSSRTSGYLRWMVILASCAAFFEVVQSEPFNSLESSRTESLSAAVESMRLKYESHKTMHNNNDLARAGFVPNPDGTAVAFDSNALHLFSEGRLRTNLTLEEIAKIFHRERKSLSLPGFPDEINRDAVLFRAVAGRLTDRGKSLSRHVRGLPLEDGNIPFYTYSEWNATDYMFTLNRLRFPSASENIVVQAISLAAAGVMPSPGDKIRATAIVMSPVADGPIVPGKSLLSAGMLPVERPGKAPTGPSLFERPLNFASDAK